MKTSNYPLPILNKPERLPAAPDHEREGAMELFDELKCLLTEAFVLYMKTKAFHWHTSGPHLRDYHLLLEVQTDKIVGIKNEIAEQARKIGDSSPRSIGDLTRCQRIVASHARLLSPRDTFTELISDHRRFSRLLRDTHELCRHSDLAVAGRIEEWIDHAEWCSWFLIEMVMDLEESFG